MIAQCMNCDLMFVCKVADRADVVEGKLADSRSEPPSCVGREVGLSRRSRNVRYLPNKFSNN